MFLGRIALFLVTNFLVVLTINIIMSVLGVRGADHQALMVFCFLYGMLGALFSLAISRITAKLFMRVQTIDPNNPGQFQGLVQMVSEISKSAGLPMPEVGVFESPEVNAFATGPTKKRSLVAVSTGLLASMSRDEIEGVIGHEIAHIKNGDMVTMTLLQGIVNAFVLFFARVIASAVASNVKGESRYFVQHMVSIVLQMVLSILGSIVVCWFSRRREFRADAGSAKLVGRNDMIAALRRLQKSYGQFDPNHAAESVAALKMSGRDTRRSMLFATHPPLEERIRRLEQYA